MGSYSLRAKLAPRPRNKSAQFYHTRNSAWIYNAGLKSIHTCWDADVWGVDVKASLTYVNHKFRAALREVDKLVPPKAKEGLSFAQIIALSVLSAT